MIDVDELAADLLTDEGERLYVYDDATGQPLRPGMMLKGHPTIGRGRCLDTHGISRDEAIYLNKDDIHGVSDQLFAGLPWFASLDSVRQTALAEMAFNLGFHGLCGFHDTLALISTGKYEAAADEMLKSHWASEVGARAHRLAEIIRTGKRP